MVADKSEIEILDPTPDAFDVDDLKLAPYPEGLDNKVLGLLGNNKPNALPLLEDIAEILGRRYKFAGIIKQNRKTFGKIDFYPGDRKTQASDELIMSFADKCDFVLCGVGDWGACTTWSIHDSVQLEKNKVPVVALATDMFSSLAQRQAEALGMPALPIVVTPHPMSFDSKEQLTQRAAKLADEIIHVIITDPEKLSQEYKGRYLAKAKNLVRSSTPM